MQGSINSVAVEQILRHEHESSVAWSLFASDDRLKDCFSFGCLFDNQTFYLFAKTGEVFEVHEFGWNNKTKVCFSWKYDCVGTFPASTVQFECKRAISSPSLNIFAWPLNLEMIALCNQRLKKTSTLFELIAYKRWCPSSEAVLASELIWTGQSESNAACTEWES